ncbi:MAG: DUF2087 domain-containing protein [Burkholderiaceae bacterium]
MTRLAIALNVPDLSAFARTLARSLAEHQRTHGALPTHQSLLNHLARAAGQRNWQALRARPVAPPAAAAAEPTATASAALTPAAQKALSQFDDQGRLVRWPNKYSVQRLAMWVLWMQFDSRRVYTEREVNQVLKAWHTWGDHVTLRRELINDRLLTRKPDGSEYRKLPARPQAEVRALLAAWRSRTGAAPTRRTRAAR